jgi:hypothetical protein
MISQRRRQLKLTSVAVVVAVLDERRLQVSQRAQARREDNQRFFRSIDEAEIIFNLSLSRFRIAVVIIIKNIRNFAFAFNLVLVLARDRARDRARALVLVFVLDSILIFARLFARVFVSAFLSVLKIEMSLLSFKIKQLKIDENENDDEEKEENEENDVCNNSRIDDKITLRVDKRIV